MGPIKWPSSTVKGLKNRNFSGQDSIKIKTISSKQQ